MQSTTVNSNATQNSTRQ